MVTASGLEGVNNEPAAGAYGLFVRRRFPGLEGRFIAEKSHYDLKISGMYFSIAIGRRKGHMVQYGIGRVIDRLECRRFS